MSENFKDQTKHGHIWNYSERAAARSLERRASERRRVRRESSVRRSRPIGDRVSPSRASRPLFPFPPLRFPLASTIFLRRSLCYVEQILETSVDPCSSTHDSLETELTRSVLLVLKTLYPRYCFHVGVQRHFNTPVYAYYSMSHVRVFESRYVAV
ncbi:uncharacterized protein LOC143183198 [Calliopsis andreniformis]|uniref:uncharacterized protein LOC143183198 n=1 Tax=Calliopsis andreniformis TaxID=337506 RepID=UPI003FCE3840